MNRNRTERQILFVHPDVYALGGAEQVCVRMMAVAQRLGQVVLVHCGGALDSDLIRDWFDVVLDPGHVRFVTAGITGRVLGHAARKPIMKYAIAMRYARRITSGFDLVVGTFGECPVPAKAGVQYIHLPAFSDAPEILLYQNVECYGHLHALLRPAYLRIARWLSGWDLREVTRKSTLVNSAWVAEVVRKVYGASSLVVSPGVEVNLTRGDQGWVEWADREMGFVMLGRIHPSKRLEMGVEIIERLRGMGYDVQLHIAGRGEDSCLKQLKRTLAGRSYVHLHLDLPRPDLEHLIVRQKFGLHACRYEHYGIASAEMQALGCVVFAPDFSGQREVVTNPDQRYVEVDDAVTKISRLLNDPGTCSRLSADAARRTNGGGMKNFEERVGAVLESALAN